MRGKEVIPGKIAKPYRITPAYAGKRYRNPSVLSCYQDHPRLCGEKILKAILDGIVSGSPPPMRGKVLGVISSQSQIRITPAYAGKSSSLPQNGQGFRDHPRLCGEKFPILSTPFTAKGSPPPMRGKVVFSDAYDNLLKDHPRLCGEKRF